MSQRDFTQLLATLDALSPEQMATLRGCDFFETPH
jgi:hypothetical protein